MAFCHAFRGNNLIYLGELGEAARAIARGREIARERGDTEVLGFTHHFSCLHGYFAGEPEAAHRHARQAVEIAERTGSSFSRSHAWLHMGLAERVRSRWRAAIDVPLECDYRLHGVDVPDRFPAREATDEWLETFERHATKERRYRRIMRHVPSDPRCKVCYTPFRGFGRVMTRFGRGPSRKNPTMCSACIEEGPEGGFETEAGVIFADVRGFTAFAESRSPKEVAELMNRFYRAATSVLLDHEAIIDKLVGDEVMGVFWPGIMDAAEPREQMVAAGLELLRAVGYGADSEAWLALGAGIHFGRAFMGNVGDQHARDWTVFGDVVNTAARLQQAAKPGQLVISESIYRAINDHAYAASRVELAAKGKTEPLTAYTFDLGPSEL